MRRASSRPASEINLQAFSTVASRFRNTGPACTAATLKAMLGVGINVSFQLEILFCHRDHREHREISEKQRRTRITTDKQRSNILQKSLENLKSLDVSGTARHSR